MVEHRLFLLKLSLFAFFACFTLMVIIELGYVFTGKILFSKIDTSHFCKEPRFVKPARIWGSIFCLAMAALTIYCSMIPHVKDLAIILRNDPPNYVEGYVARADKGRSKQWTMLVVIIDQETNEEVKITRFFKSTHQGQYVGAYYYPNTKHGIVFKLKGPDEVQGSQ